MFKFFKDKVKKFLKKTSKEVEEKAEKQVKKDIKEAEETVKGKDKEERKSLLEKIKGKLAYKLSEEDFENIFSQLEESLIESNVAMEAIDFIKRELKKELVGQEVKKGQVSEKIKGALAKALDKMLIMPFNLEGLIDKKVKEKKEKPFVMVFFGINGSGKTTTIAKITHYLQHKGLSCILAASDTFRAASIEQLEKHASKLKVKVIKQKYGADPAAVAYDAIAHAKSQGIDVVLVDTAGRMHTQSNLMQEMEKIVRVTKPDLKIFVGEAIVGNDAVEQAKTFNDKVGIDAIILSKADIDEKAGATISVSYVTGKPILFLGMGQGYKDLEHFDKGKIIKSLGF